MKATGLNHVSVHANDLETSARFYEEFFGMRRVPTPDFGYPVIWLEVGELQVHLFDRKTEAPQYHHFALDVDDYTAAFKAAKERGIDLARLDPVATDLDLEIAAAHKHQHTAITD